MCTQTPPLPPSSSSYLEVIRKFLSAGIAGVHGDEDGARAVQRNLCSLKHEPLQFLDDCDLDAQDLLGNDRENFQLYAVELVETGPRPRLGQSLEELSHGLVVEPVGTVEHNALLSNGLGQVFACFCLAGA